MRTDASPGQGTRRVCSGAYRDDSEDGVDDPSPDGGVDGLRNSSRFKDSGGVVEDLEEEEEEEAEEE